MIIITFRSKSYSNVEHKNIDEVEVQHLPRLLIIVAHVWQSVLNGKQV